MPVNDFTQTLAIWGAITGTIGTLAGIANLIIRYRHQKRDEPKLLITSEFGFRHFGANARTDNYLIIRSVGKRPITLDYIQYYCVLSVR